jgi:hypothetical protein
VPLAVNDRLELPPLERLQELLRYEKDSGLLFKRGRLVGASSRLRGKRVIIRIDNVKYLASRIIWKLVTGKDPGRLEIDHEDGDHSNDKWCNLREATRKLNCRNRVIKNESGVPGVKRNHNRWRAHVSDTYIGTFATVAEAAEARRAYIKRHNLKFYRGIS